MSMMRTNVAFILLLIALTAGAQVDVEEFTWGFDGKATKESVNLLSVLMRNNTPAAFDGALTLQKSFGTGNKRGAQIVEPLYLSPGSSRWVQFYPFVTAGRDEWSLNWGRSAGASKTISISSVGVPSTVYIAAENSLVRTPKSVRAFNEMKFPVTVCATDSLDAVILDHTPSWQKPRQRAFMDWLQRGGVVHLAQGPARERPQFPEGLAPLNNPLPRFRVGAGTVIRHDSRAVDITDKALVQTGFAPLVAPEGFTGSWGGFNFDTQALQRIGAIVRPDHNWALIYLVALAYIVLVVPVNYKLGKSSKSYWRPLLFFLAMVVGCTLILGHIGRRGHGERTAMYTVGYARHLGKDAYDVTQWINAFVTKGDTYSITHSADYSLYVTGQDEESVRGVSKAGKEGSLTVDIPVFSRRPFIHRARMHGPATAPIIREWRKEEDTNEFQLEVSLGESGLQGIKWAIVCHDNHRYAMKVNGSKLTLAGKGSLITALAEEPQQLLGVYGYYGNQVVSWDKIVENLEKTQIHRIFGTGHFDGTRRHLGRDKKSAELFVLAESADGFACASESIGHETSATLYHYTLHPKGG
jgi:hypothetical protein